MKKPSLSRLQIPDFMMASFDSTHAAISAEKLCQKANLKARLIPTPGAVKAGCGLSLRMDIELFSQIARLLASNHVAVSQWTLSTTIDGERHFIPQEAPENF